MNYTESEQQEVELMAEYTALYLLRPQVSPEFPACRGLRNIRDIRELRDMAREELNKDPDNRAMRLRQEAAQKNLDNIYLRCTPTMLPPAEHCFLAGRQGHGGHLI